MESLSEIQGTSTNYCSSTLGQKGLPELNSLAFEVSGSHLFAFSHQVGIFMGACARPSSAELLHLLGNTKPAWLPVGVKPVCSIFKYTKVSSKVSV